MSDEESRFKSDYAFLEGRILRLESEQKAIRRVHGELANEIEKLNAAVKSLREENEKIHDNPWRETTDIRNYRRQELDSLRVRARDAERAEVELASQKARFVKQLALLVPAFGTVLYAISELVRSFVTHH